MQPEIIFVYGTLKYPAIQKQIIGRQVFGISGILPGFRLSREKFHDGWFPSLIKDYCSCVYGIVYKITAAELEYCDEYETGEYIRMKQKLLDGTIAWVYIPSGISANF